VQNYPLYEWTQKRHIGGPPAKQATYHQVVQRLYVGAPRGGRGLRQGTKPKRWRPNSSLWSEAPIITKMFSTIGSGPQPTAPVSGTEVTMSVCRFDIRVGFNAL